MTRIAPVSALPPPGQASYVVFEGRELAVFNVDGRYFVTDNECPHQGAPLGDGWLDGKIISCPLHAWQFDVETGQMPDEPRICIRTYRSRVIDGELDVDLG
jgi:nitrite reductase/ring-hydroxylating ferredoxin subunit